MDFKSMISWKSLDDLRVETFKRLQDLKSKITNLNTGGIFRTLLELSLQGLADLYDLLLVVLPQGFPQYATGQWLDSKAAELGLTRHPSTKAEGVVIFGRQGTQGNVLIPVGTIVRTDLSAKGEELRFFTTAETILLDGSLQVSVPVRAEFEGSQYNVGAETIHNLVTHVSGIDFVRNDASWLSKEGTDVESDDSLRERYTLRWFELATGSVKRSYISWAKEVAGVEDVLVERAPRGANTVDVIILGSGSSTSSALVSQVQTYINERAPMTADVFVRAAVADLMDVNVLLQMAPDATDLELADAKSEGERLIRALFRIEQVAGVERLKIGQDVFRTQIIYLLRGIKKVVNVIVNAPSNDVAVTTDHVAGLNLLTITVARVTEL
ncbi:MAG: baseplate J/gp47 family protein [Firmicutes bacterium]|nr:baseplate J/gp47 family protein [Bacillota bacterium]